MMHPDKVKMVEETKTKTVDGIQGLIDTTRAEDLGGCHGFQPLPHVFEFIFYLEMCTLKNKIEIPSYLLSISLFFNAIVRLWKKIIKTTLENTTILSYVLKQSRLF